MKTFNIWNLERVYVKIENDMLKKINKKISLNFGSKRKFYNKVFVGKIPWNTFKNLLKYSYIEDFFSPIKVYIKIIEKLGISKEEFQKSITSYKTGGGINYIENPILPIEITPIFDMIIAHNICDGTVINPKNKRLPYFGYRQVDKHYRILYIKKIESIFGNIIFKKNYISNSTRPYCPPVLSSLFFKSYNLDTQSFLSRIARIPTKILSKDKNHLLAVLIAFIIDEGYIDSTQIVIALKNKLLIKDLKKICDVLGYKSKITYRNGDYREYGYLHILREGMRRFYRDYLILKNDYPVVDMGRKGKRIKDSFKIYNREIYKVKGNKEIILNILKKEQLTVNQLANRLNMTRQGVRYHMNSLIRNNKIKIANKNTPNWVYTI